MNFKAIYQQLVDDPAISAIVSDRVYRDSAVSDPTTPFIVFSTVSDNQDNDVCYTTLRVQFNLVGTLRPNNQADDLDTLREAVIENLNGLRGAIGSGLNLDSVKSTEFAGAQEFILKENKDKTIALDFLFHQVR